MLAILASPVLADVEEPPVVTDHGLVLERVATLTPMEFRDRLPFRAGLR